MPLEGDVHLDLDDSAVLPGCGKWRPRSEQPVASFLRARPLAALQATLSPAQDTFPGRLGNSQKNTCLGLRA